jgi:hypothetical protein
MDVKFLPERNDIFSTKLRQPKVQELKNREDQFAPQAGAGIANHPETP